MYHGFSDSHNFSPVMPSDIVSESITKPSMMLSARGVEGSKVDATSLLAAAAAIPAAAAVSSISSSCFDSKLLTLELSSTESLLSCFPKIKAKRLLYYSTLTYAKITVSDTGHNYRQARRLRRTWHRNSHLQTKSCCIIYNLRAMRISYLFCLLHLLR